MLVGMPIISILKGKPKDKSIQCQCFTSLKLSNGNLPAPINQSICYGKFRQETLATQPLIIGVYYQSAQVR